MKYSVWQHYFGYCLYRINITWTRSLPLKISYSGDVMLVHTLIFLILSLDPGSYPTPRSSVVDAVQPNDHAPPAGSRKIAITDDTLPPVNHFDLPPPPLPSRRRKKSRRTSEDQANKSQNPESSPIFSHNSFQSGFDRLGNLARRISREKLSSRKTSEVDGEFSFDASPPSSRKHSCFNPQSVLVLQEASVDSENERDAASFC